MSAAALEKLGAFESDVYAFAGPHGPSILKVIDPRHRTVDEVKAEVDWLLALREAGVSVAEPLAAVSGALVESLPAEESEGRVLVAFRRAPGRITGPADWSESRVEGWGEMLGRLQRHSRSWDPPGPKRKDLSKNSYLEGFAAVVPEDPEFIAAAEELVRHTGPLIGHSTDAAGSQHEGAADSGLIHADLHHGNLLLDGESWTAIDFDDASYGPYGFDLAMPLYYAVRSRTDPPPDEAAEGFLGPFLRGFRRHAPDPDTDAEEISLFLRHRELELVMALRTKLPDDEWTDRLRQTEQRLRRNVSEGREVVGLKTLRRWF